MKTRINIVIPVKNFCQAKSRLSSVLSPLARQNLMQHLFLRNLDFLQRHYPYCHLLVVTPDGLAAQWARERGVSVLQEDQCDGLNAAVDKATRWTLSRGFESQVVFFADIANASTSDLDRLLTHAKRPESLTAVASLDGGTNVLLSTPPSNTPFVFGNNSNQRIQNYADTNNIEFINLNLPSLALDVDCPSDLEILCDDFLWEQAS